MSGADRHGLMRVNMSGLRVRKAVRGQRGLLLLGLQARHPRFQGRQVRRVIPLQAQRVLLRQFLALQVHRVSQARRGHQLPDRPVLLARYQDLQARRAIPDRPGRKARRGLRQQFPDLREVRVRLGLQLQAQPEPQARQGQPEAADLRLS